MRIQSYARQHSQQYIRQQPAYVLHTRPYRESCLLVDILSRDYGRLTLVAKGARKVAANRRQNTRYLLQPFMPVMVSWSGKRCLKTLIAIELQSAPIHFSGKHLYSAFYINELLAILSGKEDVGAECYDLYTTAIVDLANTNDIETVLRCFEFKLLALLGYGIDFCHEAGSGEPLSVRSYYQFVARLGFIEADAGQLLSMSTSTPTLSGATIRCVAVNDLRDPQAVSYTHLTLPTTSRV